MNRKKLAKLIGLVAALGISLLLLVAVCRAM